MRDAVIAAQAGDEIAFARLLDSEAPRLYRAVLALVESPEDARDVIQESSIRAWRQLRNLRDADRWAAWFRRITIRQAFDQAGRQGRRRIRELHLDETASEPGPDSIAVWAERSSILDTVRRLSREDRALLGLRHGADLEVADVANAVGIPLGTAKSRLHRALARLAAVMEDQDDPE